MQFIPSKNFISTPVIIVINIFVFVAMLVNGMDILVPDTQMMIEWGANYRLLTLDGEPLRLFKCIFLHFGIIHLLMNTYALLFIGSQLEPVIGPARFAVVYVATGIFASLTSLWYHENVVSAGASGAVFGMFGLYLALLLSKSIQTADAKKTLVNLLIFVGYNLVYGMKSGVDNAAHIGGLLSGFAIGYIIKSSLINEENFRRGFMGLIGLGVAVVGFSWMALSMIPNNIKYYNDQMKIFFSRENQALEVYNRDFTDAEGILYEINERGIYYWEENLKMIQGFKRISLPDTIVKVNAKLEKYCELRIDCYHLMGKGVAENTQKYVPEQEKLEKQIETIINELNGGAK